MTANWLRYGSLGILALTAGCATGYREALRDYRLNEPEPFYQRTQEWATEAAETEVPPLPAAPEAPLVPEEAREPAQAFTRVAAEVIGAAPEWVIERREALEEGDGLEKMLANRLEWDELILAVAFMSPRVQAARERWEATLYQYTQAEFLEGLLREYRGFTRYLDIETGRPLQGGMLQEVYPYPSTLTFKGEMIREQVRLAELAWQQALREALVEAGTLFFAYQYQARGRETIAENLDILEDLVAVVEERYRTGIATQVDLIRAQTELERQRNLLRDFESRMEALAGQINAFLGRPPTAPLGRPSDKNLPYDVPSLERLIERALEDRQEVETEEARVARTAIAIRMGEVMNRPLFTQGYSLYERGMMPEAAPGEPRMPFGLEPGAGAPRPAYAQAEAYLAEIRQRLQAEEETLEQVKADTAALARTLLEEADIAHREVLLIRDVVLPQYQSAYEIALSAYTAGNISFIDLLDAERALIQARLELVESLREENQALLRLANVRGSLR